MVASDTFNKRKWFVAVPLPFVNDAEAVKGVNAILDNFVRHADQALVNIRPATDEDDFRQAMAILASNTKRECDPVMTWLWERLGPGLGIRRF